jgi:hypothetical protein
MATKGTVLGSIYKLMTKPLASVFAGESWHAWKTLLRACFEGMDRPDRRRARSNRHDRTSRRNDARECLGRCHEAADRYGDPPPVAVGLLASAPSRTTIVLPTWARSTLWRRRRGADL